MGELKHIHGLTTKVEKAVNSLAAGSDAAAGKTHRLLEDLVKEQKNLVTALGSMEKAMEIGRLQWALQYCETGNMNWGSLFATKVDRQTLKEILLTFMQGQYWDRDQSHLKMGFFR